MPGFALSADCRAPVEEVWKLLFDPARFPQWWAGVETVRAGPPGEFTLWPTGYPDFPMPQKLRVDQANERITISCQVSDIEIVWQLAEDGPGTAIHVQGAGIDTVKTKFINQPQDDGLGCGIVTGHR